MEIVDRIIGIWMMIAGGALFMFAHMIVPYMDTFSGAAYFAVAIPTAILLAAPCGALIGFGMVQTLGAITIIIVRKEVNNMVLGDNLERTCLGIFIMFIGWAMVAVAMSFAPFTHSLPYMTRVWGAYGVGSVPDTA